MKKKMSEKNFADLAVDIAAAVERKFLELRKGDTAAMMMLIIIMTDDLQVCHVGFELSGVHRFAEGLKLGLRHGDTVLGWYCLREGGFKRDDGSTTSFLCDIFPELFEGEGRDEEMQIARASFFEFLAQDSNLEFDKMKKLLSK